MKGQGSGDRPALGYSEPTVARSFQDLSGEIVEGRLAAEVPVALVYNGRPHVVMMCTPADLEDFAVGFSLTEGIAAPGELTRVDVVKYGKGVEVQMTVPSATADRIAERGRSLVGRTGCGLCGVELIGEAIREPIVVRSGLTLRNEALWLASESLASHQPLNERTNSIHAAAWASSDGRIRVAREDVGRHNALDKVIGALAREGTDAGTGFLLVTSRASYELVQKAAVAGVSVLAAVSRPTTLAVELAEQSGITLVGLLRGRSANVYSHPGRLQSE